MFSSSRRSSNHAGSSELSSKKNVKLSLENKKKSKSKKSKAVSGELDFKKNKRKPKKANTEKTHFQKLISNARRVNDIFDHKQVTNAQNQEVFSNKLLHY